MFSLRTKKNYLQLSSILPLIWRSDIPLFPLKLIMKLLLIMVGCCRTVKDLKSCDTTCKKESTARAPDKRGY